MERSGEVGPDSLTYHEFRTRIAAYKYESPSPTKTLRSPDSGLSSSAASQTPSHKDNENTRNSRKRKRASDDDSETDDQLPVLGAIPPKRRQKTTTLQKKAKKPKRGYAPPEVYEHLHMLPDYLEQYLDIMFCGINPGCSSAEIGHHYAHSTNHFWECLHLSGMTERLLSAEEDYTLPERYNYGLTNLVDRPSAEQSELSLDEMRAAVPDLMNKIVKFRPRVVCFLAKGIWEIFIREVYRLNQPRVPPPVSATASALPSRPSTPRMLTSRFFPGSGSPSHEAPDTVPPSPTKRKRGERVQIPDYTFSWGLQPFKVVHRQLYKVPPAVKETLFFVVPSPSARVVAYQWWHKVEKFKGLKAVVDLVKRSQVDTADMYVIPLKHTTSKSIYWLVPRDA